MENKIFCNTTQFIYNQILDAVDKYKSEKKIAAYELLYVKENGGGNYEPYYGNTIKAATQSMSRILNRKIQMTDTQFNIIAKNMKKTKWELLFGITEDKKMNNELMYDISYNFKFIFNKILEEAFVSNEYFEDVVDLLKDSVPFAIFLLNSKPKFDVDVYLDNDEYEKISTYENSKVEREKMLRNPEFAEIFWNATVRLLNNIDIFLCDEKNYYTKNFATISVEFLKKQKKLLFDLNKTLEKYFIFCKKEFFKSFTPSTKNNSYGLLAFNLLEQEVFNPSQDYATEMKIFNDKKGDLIEDEKVEGMWKKRKQLAILTLNYVNELSELQEEIDKENAKKLLDIEESQKNYFYYGDDYYEEYEQNQEKIAVTSDLIFQCSRCRFSNCFDNDELTNKISLINSVEDSMGVRQVYEIALEKNCRHCGNRLKAIIHISEYPVFVIENVEYAQQIGGDIFKFPAIEVILY